MKLYDARNRAFTLGSAPKRIVSLVPSSTETLHHIGCAERVVGVTRFCCHPRKWTTKLPKIGGTKDVEIDRVLALKPDLVVGNCEENTAEIFAQLDEHVPVWAAFPKTVVDAIADLRSLGHLVHATAPSEAAAQRIEMARKRLIEQTQTQGSFTYAYLIWHDPWMTISDDTFIADMLATAGGSNVFGDHANRFPTISNTEIAQAQPDVVLMSSEPFPFKPRHQAALSNETGLSVDQIRFIDGEYASWHGVRSADGLAYLQQCRSDGWAKQPHR